MFHKYRRAITRYVINHNFTGEPEKNYPAKSSAVIILSPFFQGVVLLVFYAPSSSLNEIYYKNMYARRIRPEIFSVNVRDRSRYYKNNPSVIRFNLTVGLNFKKKKTALGSRFPVFLTISNKTLETIFVIGNLMENSCLF